MEKTDYRNYSLHSYGKSWGIKVPESNEGPEASHQPALIEPEPAGKCVKPSVSSCQRVSRALTPLSLMMSLGSQLVTGLPVKKKRWNQIKEEQVQAGAGQYPSSVSHCRLSKDKLGSASTSACISHSIEQRYPLEGNSCCFTFPIQFLCRCLYDQL